MASPLSFLRRIAAGIRRHSQAHILSRWGQGRHWHRASPGFWMQLDRDAFDDRAFFFGGFDDAFVRDIGRLVRPGERAVDVGAQKGFFTLLLARAVGDRGAVLAIEADPAAIELLQAHCERNSASVVRIAEGAVSEREGDEITFQLSDQIGWSSRFPSPMQEAHVRRSLTLHTRTVDALVAERLSDIATPIALVKIDVEGSELRVLTGMPALLREHTPVIWMEINRPSIAAAGTSPQEIEDLLAPHGYRFYLPDYEPGLFGGPRVWYTEFEHLDDVERPEFDIVCVPPRYGGRWENGTNANVAARTGTTN